MGIVVYTKKQKRTLVDYLSDGDWHTAAAIQKGCRIGDKTIRAIAQDEGILLGGGRGYKLVSCASLAEIEAVRNTLLSRANEITKRANALSKILDNHEDQLTFDLEVA